MVGDLGSIPGLGRSPSEGKGYPLQYSGLENSVDDIVSDLRFHLTFIYFLVFTSKSCHVVIVFLCVTYFT